MKTLALLAALLSGITGPLFAQNATRDVAGDWQGTLHAGVSELRLILHIAKAGDGGLTGTLDSVDQGVNGIPAGPITLRESRLSFAAGAKVGSKFEGTVTADGNSIRGTWTQGAALPLVFERVDASAKKPEAKAAAPSDIDGAWLGTLEVGTNKLRVVFHIFNTTRGLQATTDSPDQGMTGIPVTATTRNGFSLKLDIKSLAGVYEGKISPDSSTIDGTLTQAGRAMPLVLRREKSAAALQQKRPQTPLKPYPYREEEVAYSNKSAGIQLAATFTIPPGNGPFPAVVLITGSGPQDRDESLLGHKPFLILSDYLTRRGIAVLRADDRGMGKSGGNFDAATSLDFAGDAEAGLEYLKTRREVNPRKLGLIGHSEGGMIAPMVAARNADVAFIVTMAGPGVRMQILLPAQVAAMAEAGGQSPEEALRRADESRAALTLAAHQSDDNILLQNLHQLSATKMTDAQLNAQIKQVRSAWFQYLLTYDPAATLEKVKCPVLAINGEKDRQVPPELDLPAIRRALEAGDNRHFEVEQLPGLNHLFQTAKTGSPLEYGAIEETMSPIALERIANWVLKQ